MLLKSNHSVKLLPTFNFNLSVYVYCDTYLFTYLYVFDDEAFVFKVKSHVQITSEQLCGISQTDHISINHLVMKHNIVL